MKELHDRDSLGEGALLELMSLVMVIYYAELGISLVLPFDDTDSGRIAALGEVRGWSTESSEWPALPSGEERAQIVSPQGDTLCAGPVEYAWKVGDEGASVQCAVRVVGFFESVVQRVLFETDYEALHLTEETVAYCRLGLW